MTISRATGVLVLTGALLGACAPDAPAPDATADSTAVTTPDDAGREDWPAAGPIDLRREHALDFTGDGADEHIVVTARGEHYDSLHVGVAIRSARGDTLWHEQWQSSHYFKYESMTDQPDSVRANVVKDHVDALLALDRFSVAGLPDVLRRGGDAKAVMTEAVQYHLAELDWRNGADLRPADALPPQAHSRINARSVAPERVAVVVEELSARPAFMYYAGGEATYAVAWSARENAFVRIYACC